MHGAYASPQVLSVSDLPNLAAIISNTIVLLPVRPLPTLQDCFPLSLPYLNRAGVSMNQRRDRQLHKWTILKNERWVRIAMQSKQMCQQTQSLPSACMSGERLTYNVSHLQAKRALLGHFSATLTPVHNLSTQQCLVVLILDIASKPGE